MSPPPESPPVENFETLWEAFVDEARAHGDAKPILHDLHEMSHVVDSAADSPPHCSPLEDNILPSGHLELLPPAILDSERGEVASQAAYIDELERLIVGSGLTGGGCSTVLAKGAQSSASMASQAPNSAGTSVALRHETRMLRASPLG